MNGDWLVEGLFWLAVACIAILTCGGASAVALALLWQDRTR